MTIRSLENRSALDLYFKITERGSTVGREIRGQVHPLMGLVAALFCVYFAIEPVQQLIG